MIKDHFTENDIIDEVEEKPTAETAEVVKLKLEFQREKRRLEREEAQKDRDAEKAAHEEAHELRLAELKEARELKMASLGKHPLSDRASTFDPARNIRLVPPFQEKEVDKYFAHFVKVSGSLNWPKESWVLLLQSVLVKPKKFIVTYQ